MTRRLRRYRVAGIAGLIACIFVGNLVLANEQARLLPLERPWAGLVFFPYPVLLSAADFPPVRRTHSKYHFHSAAVAPGMGTLSTSGIGSEVKLPEVQYPQRISAYSFQNPGKSRDDVASRDDDWHFYANPQLGVNHEHEKGVTFSLKRGF